MGDNDRVKTIGDQGRRIWLYPTWFRGRLLTYRWWVHGVLLVVLLLGPWIDVGGHPAMRFDIPGRRIYFWGMTLFATDGAYLLFFLLCFIFAVFLFTAVFGRAWCGWACPQTVFLEGLIRPIERFFEGSARQREKLDASPWTPAKIWAKFAKYSAYLLICGGIGTTFVAYFLGREGVVAAQADPWAHPAGTVIFISITLATFFDFAWFREQLCVVACPYGRFQSVLLDPDSLTVGYDTRRGEPRGRAKDPTRGDCVDCGRCVGVCPTGIDIRRGTQMECIQCMACIDVCDDVMQRLKRPQGLIRLTSERALAGEKTRLVRPRVLAYAVALVAVFVVMVFSFASYDDLSFNLGRQPATPYARTPGGELQNSLSLRISNRSSTKRKFTLRLVSPAGGRLVVPVSPLVVEAEDVAHFPVFVLFAEAPDTEVELAVEEQGELRTPLSFKFLRPAPSPQQGASHGEQ